MGSITDENSVERAIAYEFFLRTEKSMESTIHKRSNIFQHKIQLKVRTDKIY